MSRKNPFRLKGIDDEGVGKQTIKAVGLNDPARVMVPRMEQWEDIHQRMEDIYEDLQDGADGRRNEDDCVQICIVLILFKEAAESTIFHRFGSLHHQLPTSITAILPTGYRISTTVPGAAALILIP